MYVSEALKPELEDSYIQYVHATRRVRRPTFGHEVSIIHASLQNDPHTV